MRDSGLRWLVTVVCASGPCVAAFAHHLNGSPIALQHSTFVLPPNLPIPALLLHPKQLDAGSLSARLSALETRRASQETEVLALRWGV